MVITGIKEKDLSSTGLKEGRERFSTVVVIGGANIDIKGKSFGELVKMTSNPGKVSMALGGVGRNIAHNLALLGVPVTFLGVVGDDEWGRKILRETGDAGVDMEKVKISRKNSSGVYLAILDEKGEMEVAVSDMKACEEINVRYIKSKEGVIRGSKIVVMDTNLPEKSIKYVSKVCSEEGIKLVVEPVSVEKSKKLRKVLNKIDYITPNLEELESLAGSGISGVKINSDKDMKRAVEKLRNKGEGVKNIVLTLARRGIFLCGEDLDAGRMRESRNRNKNKGEFISPY
ncbi:MAG: carbohydrate kinase family protein, partial [Candidatus Caldatribacteriota bacterium]|nr:carbohydrate kinase family protein [Candidatus Caldatribacteriota bacterium]